MRTILAAALAAHVAFVQPASGADIQPRPAISKPEADVPKECSEFLGEWEAKWTYGDFYTRLWVTKVNSACIATYGYSNADSVPTRFREAPISEAFFTGRQLEFLCDSTRQGTCTFWRSGGSLSATYSNVSGGRNNASFKRVDEAQ